MILVAATGGPVTPLATVYLTPSLLLFRTAAIGGETWTLVPTVVEFIWWAALISVPYYDSLDRLLAGAVCHGGIGTGEGAPAHLEEPTSAFSRATYTWILPFLWKHYRQPLTGKDIPGLREDDGTAAVVGGFRAFQAKRDYKFEKKHGSTRVRSFGVDIVHYFMPEFLLQAVRVNHDESQSLTSPVLGRPFYDSPVPPSCWSPPHPAVRRDPRHEPAADARRCALHCDDGHGTECRRDGHWPGARDRSPRVYPHALRHCH